MLLPSPGFSLKILANSRCGRLARYNRLTYSDNQKTAEQKDDFTAEVHLMLFQSKYISDRRLSV